MILLALIAPMQTYSDAAPTTQPTAQEQTVKPTAADFHLSEPNLIIDTALDLTKNTFPATETGELEFIFTAPKEHLPTFVTARLTRVLDDQGREISAPAQTSKPKQPATESSPILVKITERIFTKHGQPPAHFRLLRIPLPAIPELPRRLAKIKGEITFRVLKSPTTFIVPVGKPGDRVVEFKKGSYIYIWETPRQERNQWVSLRLDGVEQYPDPRVPPYFFSVSLIDDGPVKHKVEFATAGSGVASIKFESDEDEKLSLSVQVILGFDDYVVPFDLSFEPDKPANNKDDAGK